jgi:hypothetical protein
MFPMVSFPFYECEKSPFKYTLDGWHCGFVLDGGEGRKAATLFLPHKMQVVKVDPDRLVARAKPVNVSMAFQREEIAKKAKTFRTCNRSFDRKAVVLVLKALGASPKAIREAEMPAAPPPPAELTLTVEEALNIRKTQAMFFKRLGIPMAEASKAKRMADVKVTFDKQGHRVEQMQFGL